VALGNIFNSKYLAEEDITFYILINIFELKLCTTSPSTNLDATQIKQVDKQTGRILTLFFLMCNTILFHTFKMCLTITICIITSTLKNKL